MSSSSQSKDASVGSQAIAEAFNMGRPETSNAVAEQPSMRAVAMMSGPSLVQHTPTMGLSKPPPLGIARPSSFSLRTNAKKGEETFHVKQVWNGLAPPSAWNVRAEDLELVPEDFPLERTHRVIEDVDATVVASRISEALRSHSIEAKFDCRAAKAKCKTNDYVSFRIRLYAGGENGSPVVVEVQRRCGSASSFMRSCRAILCAAEGKDPKEGAPRGRAPPFTKKPVGEMKCLQSVISKDIDVVGLSNSQLDNVLEMLRSRKRDSNVLGLENLLALTDAIKTAPLVAMRVSKCVILGDDRYDVREEIRALTERDMFASGFDDEEGPTNHAEQLRHLALQVFANALSMCSKDGCLEAAVEKEKWFQDYLMPSLVEEVKLAETSACGACMAACCIHSLVSCSATARRFVASNGGVGALQEAYEVGKTRHDLLANETARCLKAIDVPLATAP